MFFSSYPTPSQDANLNVLGTFRANFPKALVGYSGHELGYVATLGAVAKGAVLVERRVTLDREMKGSDHKCSLDMEQLAEMVK